MYEVLVYKFVFSVFTTYHRSVGKNPTDATAVGKFIIFTRDQKKKKMKE